MQDPLIPLAKKFPVVPIFALIRLPLHCRVAAGGRRRSERNGVLTPHPLLALVEGSVNLGINATDNTHNGGLLETPYKQRLVIFVKFYCNKLRNAYKNGV